jgi:hypothetical protein
MWQKCIHILLQRFKRLGTELFKICPALKGPSTAATRMDDAKLGKQSKQTHIKVRYRYIPGEHKRSKNL